MMIILGSRASAIEAASLAASVDFGFAVLGRIMIIIWANAYLLRESGFAGKRSIGFNGHNVSWTESDTDPRGPMKAGTL